MLLGRLERGRTFADPIVPGNDLVSHLEAAHLVYTGREGRWAFHIGRDRWHWGPGDEGSLLLSKTAPPITGVALRARLEGIGVDVIAMSATLDAAAGEQFAAHRIEWRPSDGLRLGLAEAARYHAAAWEPLYLSGAVPYVMAQRLLVQEEPDSFLAHRNNALVGIDAAWRVRPGLRTYGEFLIDDLHSRTGDNPNKLAFQLGLEGACSAGDGRLTWGAELTRVSRYVYTSFFGRAFETQGVPLGWPDGPDSRRLRLRATWDPGVTWQLGLAVADLAHGEGSIAEPFVSGAPRPDVWRFEGVVERTRELGLTARWWPRSGVDLALGAGGRWVDGAGHVAGAARDGPFGSLSVRLVR